MYNTFILYNKTKDIFYKHSHSTDSFWAKYLMKKEPMDEWIRITNLNLELFYNNSRSNNVYDLSGEIYSANATRVIKEIETALAKFAILGLSSELTFNVVQETSSSEACKYSGTDIKAACEKLNSMRASYIEVWKEGKYAGIYYTEEELMKRYA